MLDLDFIRNNSQRVKEVAKQKQIKIDLDQLLKLDRERAGSQAKVDELRAQRNRLAASNKGKKPNAPDIKKGKQLKAQLDKLESQLGKLNQQLNDLHWQVPNLIPEDTPLGGAEANKVEKETKKPKLEFKPKDHLSLAESQGWLDFERGAKVAGSKFYYLKGAAVKLEMALMRWAMDLLIKERFEPMQTPHMVRGRIAAGTGFAPSGVEDQEYRVEGEDLTLIATAEVPLTGYHADEILATDQLPRLFAGISPSYRKEAGAYGKPSRGLFRVHQFDKLEMYVICRAEDSEHWQQKLLKLEEQICAELKIPYRVVRIAAAELGAPAYKKYDIEYWSPVEQAYRELTSCSNCTDYQARNLNIRYRNDQGETVHAHTLNGTAVAFSRTLIALLENHQQPDGNVSLPPALHSYYGGGGL